MKRLSSVSTAALVSAAVLLSTSAIGSGSSLVGTVEAQSAGSGSCGISQPAFCDTFDQPAGMGNRSGQLNGTVWGVSRLTGDMNLGQGAYDQWAQTQLVGCGGTTNVLPENDVVICNGQVREATNDNGTTTTLAMYPKQPFDFAGRTGVIAFDMTNDTQGTHSFWPEIWITDKPVPAPFIGNSYPKDGVVIRLASNAEVGDYGGCPNGNNLNQRRWSTSEVDRISNYTLQGLGHTTTDCVIASSGPNGALNHIEVHISQSQIDVYATDAGSTVLKHISSTPNAGLTLTRGLVWITDTHYNAEKSPCIGGCQDQHTFTWDNFGFDGPVLPRDLAYDVPDALPAARSGSVNLGWLEQANAITTKSVNDVVDPTLASGALLTANFYHTSVPSTLIYSVNGHQHTYAWPYPDRTGYTQRSLAIPLDLSEVNAGTNTIGLGASDQPLILMNMDLIMVGAGGGGSGSDSPAPSTSTPTPAPTLAGSTPTPTAPATATATPSFRRHRHPR